MALILNIDTSTETASVCLARNGEPLLLEKNQKQNDHASWLHNAIKDMMEKVNINISAIDAVAVTIGPGSYTGLRVSLAAAKGICYALQKPLITLNTLSVMANAIKNEKADLLCPMIDARRLEVFTAVYSKSLDEIKKPKALIIDEHSFNEELKSGTICFSGSGSKKLKALIENANAVFSEIEFSAINMTDMSERLFIQKEFAELAYTEPLYLKEFYSPARKLEI